MVLIIAQKDVRSSFIFNWTSKIVPATLLYGEKSRKASIVSHVKEVDETGIFFLTGVSHTVLILCNCLPT